MKYYTCVSLVIGLLLTCPQSRGTSSPPTFRIETVAGSGLNGDQGPAIAAQISSIQGIAMDRFGNLFLSDTDNHRVRRVSSSGIITTVAGTGVAGFCGDGGAATAAQLNLPYGLAIDYNGNLYIADLGNQRVRRVAADGTITTVAGEGRRVSSPDGFPATQTSLLSPRNLAVDDAGTLYISEFEGHRVRKLTADGKISTVAGTGQSGYRGDGSAASSALLSYPAGIAIDRSGALYIADSGNNRIRKIYAGGAIGTVLGGSSSTAMRGPIAVAVDSAGTIYAADSSFVVRAFTLAGKWTDFAGTGAPIYSGDGGLATRATLTSAHDLLASPNSTYVYIADGTRVRCVDTAGIIHTYAGDGYVHSVGDRLSATSALLNRPSAVALDFAGNLYVADTGTQRVRQVLARGAISTVAGSGVAGMGAEGAIASTTPLNSPMGVAIDRSGNLVIADTYNHRVRQVLADGSIRTVAGTGTSGSGADGAPPLTVALRGPRGICFDRASSLYIVDTSNHRALRVPPGGLVQTVAGNGSPGDGGDGGQGKLAQLNQPAACQVDSYGSLYIADTLNHRVRKVSAGGTISTVAGTGAVGFSGDEAAATAAQLAAPSGIAVEDAGNLYIADTGNHRIRLVTADGVIHTIAGIGGPGFSGDSGPALSAQLNLPAGLTLDGSGALYIADSGNQRVRRLVPDALMVPPDPIVPPPALTVVNALSGQTGPVAPGEIVSVFGAGLGPESGVPGNLESTGLLANLVAGVEVRFDNVPVPLFYVQNQQINAQAPYTLAGASATHIEVRVQGESAGSIDLPVSPASPALLPVILNPDGSTNGEAAPVAAGAILTLYATGEGLNDGSNIAGRPAGVPLAHPLLPVVLTVAGIPMDVLFAGSAPGQIGVMQINVRIPGGFLSPGKTDLSLTVGGIAAPAIPIWLK
jgi:uncharacterized protein (TIGR03437 family)